LYIIAYFTIGDPGIDLCRADIGMPEHFTYGLNWKTFCQSNRGGKSIHLKSNNGINDVT